MKNKSFLLKIAAFALAIAPEMTQINSFWWFGEPKIPKQMSK